MSLEFEEMLCGYFIETVLNFVFENEREVRISVPKVRLLLEGLSNLLQAVNYKSAVAE